MSRSSIIARLRPFFAALAADILQSRHGIAGLIPLYFTIVKYNIDHSRVRSHRIEFSTPARRAEYGSHEVSAPAWSPAHRPAVSHERLRQANHLWSNDSLYRQCRLAAYPAWLGDCRCLRDRWWSAADTRLSCARGCVWPGRVHFGNGHLLSQEFRRSESDDPFSQEHHDHRRALADRAFWSRTLQPGRARSEKCRGRDYLRD